MLKISNRFSLFKTNWVQNIQARVLVRKALHKRPWLCCLKWCWTLRFTSHIIKGLLFVHFWFRAQTFVFIRTWVNFRFWFFACIALINRNSRNSDIDVCKIFINLIVLYFLFWFWKKISLAHYASCNIFFFWFKPY